jgi:hypothetical protein
MPETVVGQAAPPTSTDSTTASAAAEPVLGESSDEAANGFADDVAAKLAATKPLVTTTPPDRPSAAPNVKGESQASPSGRLPWEEPTVSAKPVATTEPRLTSSANPEASVTSTPPNPEANSAPSTSAPQSQPPSADDPAHSPRRIAWLLGNKLSLSALANDRGGAVDETAKLFSQAQTLAEMLGTTVSDLPPARATASTDGNFDRALQYLFSQGQPIGRTLATKYGDDQAALFELAVKSNILLALYRPHASVVGALSSAIEQAGGRSGLPVKLWQPLMDAMANNAPAEEVRQSVYRMHSEVDKYLASPH